MNDAYPLPPFRIRSPETLCDIMRAYPLATLMSGSAGNAAMTLIPLLVERDATDQITLSGHLDRNNPQALALRPGVPLSFHFVGPNSYASPDLYEDPQLPGWLYVAVQGDGEISELLDGPELRTLLIQSTATFGNSSQQFALDGDDPRIDRFLPGILGFRIRVKRISGIAKLAQDKGPDHAEIAMTYLAGQSNGGSAGLFAKLLRETL